MSLIPKPLLRSYRSAIYRICLEGRPVDLAVGRRCPGADALLRSLDKASGVFITAWNPYSRVRGRRANEAGQRRLAAWLRRAGVVAIPAVGLGRGWSEPSFFAAGLSRAAGSRLGRRFRQNAVLHVAQRRPVELVLLR